MTNQGFFLLPLRCLPTKKAFIPPILSPCLRSSLRFPLLPSGSVVVPAPSRVQLFAALYTQPTRPPCPSLSLGVCSNSCPLSEWCHQTISSSVAAFSSCLQSFPASRSFLMSQLFTSGSQGIGASASVSVLPMTIQSWFPIGSTCLIFFNMVGHWTVLDQVTQKQTLNERFKNTWFFFLRNQSSKGVETLQ